MAGSNTGRLGVTSINQCKQRYLTGVQPSTCTLPLISSLLVLDASVEIQSSWLYFGWMQASVPIYAYYSPLYYRMSAPRKREIGQEHTNDCCKVRHAVIGLELENQVHVKLIRHHDGLSTCLHDMCQCMYPCIAR